MFTIVILLPSLHGFIDSCGRKLTVSVIEGYDFVTARLNRACFMYVYVARCCTYDALPRMQERINNKGIGLRAAHQESNLAIGAVAGL